MDVIFDFGNVLVEWSPLRLIRDHFDGGIAAAATPAEFMALWMNEAWAAYDRGDVDTVTAAREMAPVLGCDTERLIRFFERIPYVLAPILPAVDALSRLCDARDTGAPIRVFYLSNMPKAFADVIERRFDWVRRFDGGLFSGRERVSKPDPAIYAALESRYGVRSGRALFFDDVPANVAAARSRGWRAVQVHGYDDVIHALESRGLLTKPVRNT